MADAFVTERSVVQSFALLFLVALVAWNVDNEQTTYQGEKKKPSPNPRDLSSGVKKQSDDYTTTNEENDVSVTAGLYYNVKGEILGAFSHENYMGYEKMKRKVLAANFNVMTPLPIKLVFSRDETVPFNCTIENGGSSVIKPKEHAIVIRHLLKNGYEFRQFVMFPLVPTTPEGFLDLMCFIGSTPFPLRLDWRIADKCEGCRRSHDGEETSADFIVYNVKVAQGHETSGMARHTFGFNKTTLGVGANPVYDKAT